MQNSMLAIINKALLFQIFFFHFFSSSFCFALFLQLYITKVCCCLQNLRNCKTEKLRYAIIKYTDL